MAIEDLKKRYENLQGLLNTSINQGQGGLLSNIPQSVILGAALYGQGIQGKDPFAALLPSVLQTAQLQKYMTPKTVKPSFETFISKDGKDQITINTSTREGLAKATDLTEQGYTKFSKAVQSGDIAGLQKSTKTKTEGELRSGLNLLTDLNLIKAAYKPEFSTIEGKAKFKLFSAKDKISPGSLNLEERQYLASYGAWDANSQQYFNRYRKEITGVAAGEKEIGYLKSSIPSDTDSPAVYQAKLENQIKIQERLNNSAAAFLKTGAKAVYTTDSEGNKIYSQEFLDYVKENKVPPTGQEIENLLKAYKTDRGYDYNTAKQFLDVEYNGIDWEKILTGYIKNK